EDSALRGPDMVDPEIQSLTSFHAPLMQAIVPLIFVSLLIPALVFGFVSGRYKSSGDLIQSMKKSMESMGYYIVMAFFCALFIDAFSRSNIGLLIAIKGANFLQAIDLPGQINIVGIVILSSLVNTMYGFATS